MRWLLISHNPKECPLFEYLMKVELYLVHCTRSEFFTFYLFGACCIPHRKEIITPEAINWTTFTFALQNNYGHFSIFNFNMKKETYFKIITCNFDLTKMSKLISFPTFLFVVFCIKSKMFWCGIYCHCISCLGWYNYEK